MTSGLTITVDGKPVPLDDCGWFERRPCGCIVSGVCAVSEGEGGWVLATAEQAASHWRQTKSERDRAARAGLTVELMTMAHYRKHVGANWECEQHAKAVQS